MGSHRRLLADKEGRLVLTGRHPQRGVTLIETMIGLAIVGMVLAFGVPSFGIFIQNSQIRNAAEAIQNGLNLARAEAVRRNTSVQFVLGTRSSWTVGCTTSVADLDGDGVADCPGTIQARANTEGSANALVATTPTSAATLHFNGLGRILSTDLAAGSSAVFNISNSTGGSCATAGPMHCLRIVVTSAGQVRMCDPALASTDTQGC